MKVMMKTHLIVTEQSDEYDIKTHKRIIDTCPKFYNDKFLFIIITGEKRLEIKSLNINDAINLAKKVTMPRGRTAVTTDKARIYIDCADGGEVLLTTVTHNHIKKFAPMFDPVEI